MAREEVKSKGYQEPKTWATPQMTAPGEEGGIHFLAVIAALVIVVIIAGIAFWLSRR